MGDYIAVFIISILVVDGKTIGRITYLHHFSAIRPKLEKLGRGCIMIVILAGWLHMGIVAVQSQVLSGGKRSNVPPWVHSAIGTDKELGCKGIDIDSAKEHTRVKTLSACGLFSYLRLQGDRK